MTVYRLGDQTPFVDALMRAAESGKQVAVLVEVRARFDEKRNLHWAEQLERAGAHVIYGMVGLKTHCKVALVVREEDHGLQCYAHIGTGNYHVRTSSLYTDLGLFTSNPSITEDVVGLFHFLTGHSAKDDYRSLLVSPVNMRQSFLDRLNREVEMARQGRVARVILKMNQLEDRQMISSLVEASQQGVRVDLIVRGFCCLKPNVPGYTENIHVRSLVGRFLEHARIFWFSCGNIEPLEGEFFIGSADWMHRNLSGRVEAVVPILLHEHKRRIWDILQLSLNDCRLAWTMLSDGSYRKLEPEQSSTEEGIEGTQSALMRRTHP
jgi:polyphosphate kinase